MKILKSIVAVLIVTCLFVPETIAQDGIGNVFTLNDQKKVHLVKTGTLLSDALAEIESKYNVVFLYEDHLLESKRLNREIAVTENSIMKGVQSVISDYPLALKQLDNRLFGIVPKSETEVAMETVSGQITDEEGTSLPGVNIVVKGTTTGTTSGPDGNWELGVPSLQDTLMFSFVGFVRQEVAINGRTQIDITMVPETFTGEELVVVGYGTREKETLTGSVSAVGGEELQKTPVSNVSNTIGGRLPGVVTVTDSGEPGYDGSTIRIRGAHTLNDNSPLIVIDGVPNRAGGLDRLNPRDIQNISVLKDASAAIYGAQAANGVILVTTKRGRANQAPQVTLDFNQGFNQPTRIPEMADAPTYLRMLNEIDIYRGRAPRYAQEEIQRHENIGQQDPWLYHDTDWFSEALKPMSYQTRMDASVSGGSNNMQYRLSIGGLTEDGYYERSSTRYSQYNFRSNIDGQISDNVSVRFDVNGRYEDRNFPTQPAGATFRMIMRGKPNLPAFWPDGSPGPDIENGQNPVVTGTDVTGYDADDRYYLQTNLGVDIEIPGIEGLGVRANVAYDKDFRQRRQWFTPWTLYTFDEAAYMDAGGNPANGSDFLTGSLRPGGQEPQLTQSNEDNYNILLNLVAEYQRDFDDHSMGILVGTEQQRFKEAEFEAFRRNYISTAIDQLFAGGEALRQNFGTASQGSRFNFFSRLNYDYQDKYLLEFVGRYDGSYIFPEEGRFGFFPAFSLGWRLTEEEFFTNNVGFFDELKLRTSWGQTGNDRIDPYQFLATYAFGDLGNVFGVSNEVQTLYQTRTPNPAVTWEVANQFDIGIEGAILDDKLSFELDHFNYLRTDILTQRNASVPQSAGISLPEENIGEVKSWGYDGSITWRDQASSDFLYSISLNAGWATNEIKFWDEAPGAPAWQQSTGAKMDTDLYYVADGIFQDQAEVDSRPHWPGARPGDVIFKDINGDGSITADDRRRIERNDIPEWTGGININGSYKNFDFTIFFQGAAGASQYYQTQSGEFGNYFQEYAENRWRPDPNDASGMSPHPDYGEFSGPRTFNREEEYWIQQRNTYFYRDTDYIRLKTLEIGYNMPDNLMTKLGMRNLRIYANGFNLLTFDKFKLMDPEASSQGGEYYPQKRVINVGLTASF
ncbi:TonB-dependent receptor [Aliifodinibius sp. S!AR15-10]|uniref:SusC/RagA family TonB-linked outer membrane protein n=1 Tax=Aliifodinibius sp. S!AR15-10 TaxID=2950437 RepID=UPI00286710AA|nr:TonB-dependent receptor [Aliifodinibius sp. S!AR15-10]MDR8392550.1 TonB-dependent receptor [Aliifodinibius sp. S!AR15-10]